MTTVRQFQFLFAGSLSVCITACSSMQVTHVAPGHSARAAIAARNAPQPAPADLPATADQGSHPAEPLPPLPSGGAGAPKESRIAEGVADAYTRGSFAMQAGQNAEAIVAFQEAVKADPDFTDAWGKLAILYQKDGQSAKATEAFKKAKRLGDANGGTVTRDNAGGLQLP
jgi:tetratricopeptide (TPR) repeat protein